MGEIGISKEYKNSTLVKIPEEWKVNKLEDIVYLISGLHLGPEEYNKIGNGVPYFTGPTDYTNNPDQISKWTALKSVFAIKGDILLTVKGSGVGSLHQLHLDKVSIGRQIMAVRVKNTNSPVFIYNCLCQKDYHFQELAKGNMIPGLTRSDILKTQITVPPSIEQYAIATCLSIIDETITKSNQLIAQKELRKKWLMQQLLWGKKRLKGFGGEWAEIHIRDIAKEVSLRNNTDKQLTVLSCTKYNGLVPSLEYFGRKIYSDDIRTYKIVPKGHFAYATNHIEEGSIGYQDSSDEALISPMYTVFKTDKSVNDYFFFKLLKSYRLIFEYNARMEGSIDRRGGLRWDSFSIIKVTIPSHEEQTAIAHVLQAADKEIQLLKAKVEKLKEEKKGMMQVLLTGKRRLKIQ